jgi:hypothetical protein
MLTPVPTPMPTAAQANAANANSPVPLPPAEVAKEFCEVVCGSKYFFERLRT